MERRVQKSRYDTTVLHCLYKILAQRSQPVSNMGRPQLFERVRQIDGLYEIATVASPPQSPVRFPKKTRFDSYM